MDDKRQILRKFGSVDLPTNAKTLTRLDVAFLKDLGNSINATAVPEPISVLVVSILAVAAAWRIRRRTKSTEVAAIQGGV